MRPKSMDLLLVVGISVALIVIIAAFPAARPLRIALGLPFLFFLPGYALTAALYPTQQDLDAVERTALSVGLSIAVLPLIGLGLNFSPWGVRLSPILASLTALIALATAVALYRRRASLLGGGPGGGPLGQPKLSPRILPMMMVAGLAAVVFAAYMGTATQDEPERFTEFYVLGPDGRIDEHPPVLQTGESAWVTLGLVNREGREIRYRVVIKSRDGIRQVATPLLAHEQRWEQRVLLFPLGQGPDHGVEFLLYRDGDTEPYRRLWLQLEVAQGLLGFHRAGPPPPPAQRLEPMPQEL